MRLATGGNPRKIRDRAPLQWGEGDEAAPAHLTPLLHQELQRIARQCMRRERAGKPVNEAYLRLMDVRHRELAEPRPLSGNVGAAHAASWWITRDPRAIKKRGGGAVRVTFDEALPVPGGRDLDLVAVDDALEALAKMDERRGRIVELRFFGGLSVEGAARVLKVSPETVMRDWKLAKAWLLRELRRGGGQRA